MSTVETTAKAGSYDNGAPRAASPTAALTDQERATLTKILANPLDFPAEFPGWLDDFIRLRLTASAVAGLAAHTGEVGELLLVLADYTAQTGVYTIEFKKQTWMYLNGATFTAADYPALNTYLGGNVLPDTRGRSLWTVGTNAALDLFDNDGVAVASRTPSHTHSGPSHTHSFSATSGAPSATVDVRLPDGPSVRSPASDAHTHSVSGTTGSGGTGTTGSDTTAHIAIGSAFVHV